MEPANRDPNPTIFARVTQGFPLHCLSLSGENLFVLETALWPTSKSSASPPLAPREASSPRCHENQKTRGNALEPLQTRVTSSDDEWINIRTVQQADRFQSYFFRLLVFRCVEDIRSATVYPAFSATKAASNCGESLVYKRSEAVMIPT